MYERGQYDLISYIIILALLCTHCLYCDIFEGVPFNANECLAEHRNFSPCISKTDFEDMCVYVYKIKTKHEKAKTKKVKKKFPTMLCLILLLLSHLQEGCACLYPYKYIHIHVPRFIYGQSLLPPMIIKPKITFDITYVNIPQTKIK